MTSTEFGSTSKLIVSECRDPVVVSEMTDAFRKKLSKSFLASLMFLRTFLLNLTTELSGFSFVKIEKFEFEFEKLFLISGRLFEIKSKFSITLSEV